MNTIYCRGCGVAIHQEAQACPHCGAPQAVALSPPPNQVLVSLSTWPAWVGLAIAGIASMVCVDPPGWGRDEYVGTCMFSVIAAVLAAMSLSQRRPARAAAIATLVVSALAFLTAAGLLTK